MKKKSAFFSLVSAPHCLSVCLCSALVTTFLPVVKPETWETFACLFLFPFFYMPFIERRFIPYSILGLQFLVPWLFPDPPPLPSPPT